jgi:hypothetical protein
MYRCIVGELRAGLRRVGSTHAPLGAYHRPMLMRRASSGVFDTQPDGREPEKVDDKEAFSFALRACAMQLSHARALRGLNGA